MTRDTTYPGATWNDKTRFGGVIMGGLDKLMHHSTETSGLPGYPTFAPNMTIDPFSRRVWQHMRVDMSASTLRNPESTNVSENRDRVCQIEWVMYCDDKKKASSHHISKLGEREYRFIAKVVAWFHEEWNIPLRSTVKWVAYPASYGVRASQRLSSSEYDNYKGHLGHQHASGNDHGDPGNWDFARILRYAREIIEGDDPAPAPVSKPSAPPPALKGQRILRSDVIAGGKVTTGFGVPGNNWAAKKHTGDDWNHPTIRTGNVLLSPVHGKVIERSNSTSDPLSWGRAYGCGVIIEDAIGDRTAICHMKPGSLKNVGNFVHAGEALGIEGETGNVTGPHSHVERRHDGADDVFGYWDFERPLYDSVRPTVEVIYVSDLRAGVKGNSSVYWLRRVLNEVSLPDGQNMRITGDWSDGVADEVRKYQKMKGHNPDGVPDEWQMKDLIKRAGGGLADILTVKA